MADAAIYDSETEDLRSEYATDDSNSDDESIGIGDEARRRRRASSIDKRRDEDGDMAGSSTGVGPSSLGSTSSPAASPLEDAAAPILDAGPLRPPPDYAAATAHREEEERLAGARRSELAEQRGWPLHERSEIFDSEHPLVRNGLLRSATGNEPPSTNETTISEPQVQSNHDDSFQRSSDEEKAEVVESVSYWSKQKSAWKRHGRKSLLRSCLIVLMVFVVVYFALTNYSLRRISSLQSRPPSSGSEFMKPHLSHPPIAVWTKYKSTSVDIWYNPPDPRAPGFPHYNFTFLESLAGMSHDTRISGKITVMGPTRRIEGYARVTVEIASTSNLRINEINFSLESGVYELLYPDLDASGSFGWLDIAVTIEHNHGWHLGDFTVNTTYFDIDIDGPSLFSDKIDPWGGKISMGGVNRGGLWVERGTFSTVEGSISGHGWKSGQTSISSREGEITGTWPIRNTIAFETGSGDIRVSIAPQAHVKGNPDSPLYSDVNVYNAGLNATSVDGSISINIAQDEDLSGPPERDYHAHISTVNGDIYGDYFFGSQAYLGTSSGEINVRMIPVTIDPPNATLYTENDSGYSGIWVLKPIVAGKDFSIAAPHNSYLDGPQKPSQNGTMASLRTKHRSGTGSVSYIFPTVWSGTGVLECESHISLDGDDMYEVLRNKTKGGSRINFMRGHGWSTTDIQAREGHIYLGNYDG